MTTKLFCLTCEDQPQLLSHVLQHFTRPGYAIHTLSQARTDVRDTISICVEVVIPAAMVDQTILKLKRIIGVLEVTISFGATLQSAIYRLEPSTAVWQVLQCHNTSVLAIGEHLLIQQVGQTTAIRKLFNELDGPALIAFQQLPLPGGRVEEQGPVLTCDQHKYLRTCVAHTSQCL